MPFVLDRSMTMAWVFPDEADDATAALQESLIEEDAVVPSLWPMEVANVLLAATRGGRIRKREWKPLMSYLSALPIQVDAETAENVFSAALPLAHAHALSVYDAVYLELAIRKGLPLATLDGELRAACSAVGVKLR